MAKIVSQFRLNRLIAGVILAVGCGTAHMALADECYVDDPDIRGTYTGGCVNGKAHGQGEAQGKDHYKGEFVNGKTQGKGVYTWADGSKYVGERKDDRMHGKGVTTWANGSKYVGDYSNGSRDGFGKLSFVREDGAISSYQEHNKGFWQGDTYIVQGVFANNKFELECAPNADACAKEVERACKSRYVGQRLSLWAPYSVPGFLLGSVTKYTDLPFKVVGVGKTHMTIEAIHEGGIIGDVASVEIACNAKFINKQ